MNTFYCMSIGAYIMAAANLSGGENVMMLVWIVIALVTATLGRYM